MILNWLMSHVACGVVAALVALILIQLQIRSPL